ncbi:MAG: hypothetical protein LBB26_02095 [Puniceicoccales bacterium]|nr:hypothetical protein [Puniceicoccales bacterium]
MATPLWPQSGSFGVGSGVSIVGSADAEEEEVSDANVLIARMKSGQAEKLVTCPGQVRAKVSAIVVPRNVAMWLAALCAVHGGLQAGGWGVPISVFAAKTG